MHLQMDWDLRALFKNKYTDMFVEKQFGIHYIYETVTDGQTKLQHIFVLSSTFMDVEYSIEWKKTLPESIK